MKTTTKVIKTKLGLLRLAEQLGNVSQACKLFGYSRDSFLNLGCRHQLGSQQNQLIRC